MFGSVLSSFWCIEEVNGVLGNFVMVLGDVYIMLGFRLRFVNSEWGFALELVEKDIV